MGKTTAIHLLELESEMTRQDQQIVDDAERFLAAGSSEVNFDLMSRLGCHTTLSLKGPSTQDVQTSISFSRRKLFQKYLPKVLAAIVSSQENPAPISSVLGGLWSHDCWRACLSDEQQTYCLAAGLLIFIESYSSEFSVDVAIKQDILKMLNLWLSPPVALEILPSANVVSRLMFGDAWCTLFLPETTSDPLYAEKFNVSSGGDETPDYAAGRLVLECRPTFIAGLCLAQVELHAAELPTDICGHN